MNITDLDEVRTLAFKYEALKAMTAKSIPSLKIDIGGSTLTLGIGDDEFLSDLGDILHDQLQKVKRELEEMGVTLPEEK